MSNINFELYKVFYHVANHCSFSIAASHLYITQSAVSQAIKQLERQLDCQLFFRNTKQVRLTKAGEVLFQHVDQAFNFLQAGHRSLAELQSLNCGELKLGASDTICKYFLLPYLKQFHQLYPKIKISIINRPSLVCSQLLTKGLVDLAIINLPHQEAAVDKNTNIVCLQPMQDVFAAGPDYFHLEHQLLTLPQLAQLPLLMLEKNAVARRVVDDYFQLHAIQALPAIELGSIDILVELVKISLGICCISRQYIQKELAAHELVILNVDPAIAPRCLGLATHAVLPVPAAAQKFIDLLLIDQSMTHIRF